MINEIDTDQFMQKISTMQNDFYSNTGKNTIFKNKQKIECASDICSKIGFEKLIQNTAYIIPNTNIVYFDYIVFKMYANPENFVIIVNYVIELFQSCIEQYGNFETHLNINTFTISSFDRYKQIINIFCTKCFNNNTTYSQYLKCLVLYNSPNIIDTLTILIKPFIEQKVSYQTIILNKKDSIAPLNVLLSQLHNSSNTIKQESYENTMK